MIGLLLLLTLAGCGGEAQPPDVEATAATEAAETQPTEPATKATEAATEETEPPTEATEPPTEATEAPTTATEAPTEATVPPTEATVPPTQATQIETQPTEPPTEAQEETTYHISGYPNMTRADHSYYANVLSGYEEVRLLDQDIYGGMFYHDGVLTVFVLNRAEVDAALRPVVEKENLTVKYIPTDYSYRYLYKFYNNLTEQKDDYGILNMDFMIDYNCIGVQIEQETEQTKIDGPKQPSEKLQKLMDEYPFLVLLPPMEEPQELVDYSGVQ